jgi:flavodoxin
MNLKEAKILAAYFSRAGDNYVSGKIVNLPVGNTEVVAKMIQEMTGCDLFKIEAVNPYPKEYNETTNVARKEQNDNARPELAAHVENMDAYDVIILGYPNWWGTFPMAVFTFLEEYDFSKKTILPFCTHEGSGMGRSESEIKKLCPNANLLSGLPIKGSSVQGAEKAVSQWLEKSGIL